MTPEQLITLLSAYSLICVIMMAYLHRRAIAIGDQIIDKLFKDNIAQFNMIENMHASYLALEQSEAHWKNIANERSVEIIRLNELLAKYEIAGGSM